MNSLDFHNPVAERLSDLVDPNKCTIVDRDAFGDDPHRGTRSVELINGKIGWSNYNEIIISELWEENRYALFALKGEDIVGYVQFYERMNRPGITICFIAVDPNEGRGGIGKNLMFAALAKIARLGYSCANLSYWSDKPNLAYFYNQIAVDGGMTKVETDDGEFLDGAPKRLVVYDLCEEPTFVVESTKPQSADDTLFTVTPHNERRGLLRKVKKFFI